MESFAIRNVPVLNPHTPPPKNQWKADLAASFTHVEDLLRFLDLPPEPADATATVNLQFPFRVTTAFAQRMNKGDPADPLLLQVLPKTEEMSDQPGFLSDPVGDLRAMARPGLLHKYRGRALLVTTGACAIHCRYCFRREFPYAEGLLGRSREAEALAYIAQDASINEVILSGGDPLMLDDSRLQDLIAAIAAIPQVSRLRLHTRLPILLPSRVDAGLVKLLGGGRLATSVVIHANHAQELDAEVGQALRRLSQEGVVLLNQSVLLRGVNDSVQSLADLSERLFLFGVLPYYLHLLDKARGTAHFEVPDEEALVLYDSLRQGLPGYLVPRLVREIAGEPYKSLL